MRQFLKILMSIFLGLTLWSYIMPASGLESISSHAPTAALSVPSNSNAHSQNQKNSQLHGNSSPAETGQALPTQLSTKQLGYAGPLGFGVTYNDLTGYNSDLNYTQALNEVSAISLIGQYGSKMYRASSTVGFQVDALGLFKLTAERLSQVLPFQFDSGDVNQRVGQNAFGFRYKKPVSGAFQGVELGGYYSKAENVGLSSLNYTSGGSTYTNSRNIAGGTSRGVDLGSSVLLSPWTKFAAAVYYDDLTYDTQYNTSSSNFTGAGVGASFTQLLNSQLKFEAKAEVRKIYDTYLASLSWLPKKLKRQGIEFSLNGQHLTSNNAEANSNSVMLSLSFDLEGGETQTKHYVLASAEGLDNVKDWVSTPAVYMQQVLAIVDQKSVLAGSAPTITSISPSSGLPAGGSSVTITGTGFTGATAVNFGATAATSYTVDSATQITATSPTGSGTVDITVTTASGTSATSSADQFSYFAAPTVTSLSVSVGPAAGGTSVVITGTNFTNASAVKFASNNASTYTVDSATQITATTPAGTGNVNVSVTTPSGTGTLTGGFTYGPTVSALSPSVGTPGGGTSVTITGTGFLNPSTAKFGATTAASTTFVSSTQLTAVSPVGSGVVDVTVTTAGGTSPTSSADQFTYQGSPTVTSTSPSSGSTLGGTSITIVGTNFTGATAVTIGGVAATSFSVTDSTHIAATTPAGSAGAVNVVVTTPVGTGTGVGVYTYAAPPVVSSLNITNGLSTGGYPISINGSGFTGATAVHFGSASMVTFSVFSDTLINGMVPASSPSGFTGTVDVTVTTPIGTSATGAGDQFTYN